MDLAGFHQIDFAPGAVVFAGQPVDFDGREAQFLATIPRLTGLITGDPDFDLLRITAGNDFGLPRKSSTPSSRSIIPTTSKRRSSTSICKHSPS